MNLLENYIQKGYKITKVDPSPVPNVPFIKFEGDVDCYGNVQHEIHYWSEDEWQEIKKKGYYMG